MADPAKLSSPDFPPNIKTTPQASTNEMRFTLHVSQNTTKTLLLSINFSFFCLNYLCTEGTVNQSNPAPNRLCMPYFWCVGS